MQASLQSTSQPFLGGVVMVVIGEQGGHSRLPFTHPLPGFGSVLLTWVIFTVGRKGVETQLECQGYIGLRGGTCSSGEL